MNARAPAGRSSAGPALRQGQRRHVGQSSLLLVNGRLALSGGRFPGVDAVLVRDGRIVALGDGRWLRDEASPCTRLVDAEGGTILPAFHDPHLHLLAYARRSSWVDCRGLKSIAEVQRALAARAATLRPGGWVRAIGLDERQWPDHRLPDRADLDGAAPHHPVRVQHRTGHLDLLNSAALAMLGLLDDPLSEVERDVHTGRATGRVYQGARLLHGRLPRPAFGEIAADVRAASERLLSQGITTVQDATETNGPDELALFERLQQEGALAQRLLMMVGIGHVEALSARRNGRLRLVATHVKLMVDEATMDVDVLNAQVGRARRQGWPVALHAVAEAELVTALEALQRAGPRDASLPPDRIEHGAVIPDDFLPSLRAAGVHVVGQPALLRQRGDHFLAEYPQEQHGWLYRVRSLLDSRVPYAASSDAPIGEPSPEEAFAALTGRTTATGLPFGRAEALSAEEALACLTAAPAATAGLEGEIGVLRPGARADLVILASETPVSTWTGLPPVRCTILGGAVVWQGAAS
ncbi:MAG: amidohydrolase family protein [Chloroflexi bacterium]|nr:amidohydrolase family protein [Chloroflexota bacterium]